MGIFTELVLSCDFPEDIPDKVINIIKWYVNDPTSDQSQFSSDLFDERGLLDDGGPSITGKAHAIFEKNIYKETYELTVRTNSKNSDDKYQKFLAWAARYTSTEGYAGYIRGEIAETPTLIYFQQGQLSLKHIITMEDQIFPIDLSKYD